MVLQSRSDERAAAGFLRIYPARRCRRRRLGGSAVLEAGQTLEWRVEPDDRICWLVIHLFAGGAVVTRVEF